MSAQAAENPHAGQGAVLLDIGDDVGAVVVTMPEAMVGAEVEIRPEDGRPRPGGHEHGHHVHVAVVARPIQGGRLPSLVFPEVRQGRYGLYRKGSGDRSVAITVRGGEVTSVSWPVG